jgi:valyl-tRNA synthetase
MKELDKAYDHSQVEHKIYQKWLDSGYFNPDNLSGEPFSMALPPPNVTGTLHIGHAYEGTLQDIIIRYKRMQGYKTLWVPGTDHAAIATQAKVEKAIYKDEGKSRHDLGREEFVRRVKDFALDSQKTILSQLPKMGFSLDWSRLAFTLDEQRGLAVRTAFKKMYDTGLIYRGFRVVNWDPKGQTTVSDDEVVHQTNKGQLYTFRYDKDFPIAIATTRPETKLGDVAVAVNPNDNRYQEFIGKTYKANFVGVDLEIKIIADQSIDPEFGTGAVGITPAHSMTDWEISQRHNLPLKQVIDERAKITGTGTEWDGKKTLIVREEILVKLGEDGLLEKTEEIEQNIATSERTGAVIEPLPKLQWFVDVDKEFKIEQSKIEGLSSGSQTTLKQIMKQVVQTRQVKIFPEQFEKRYFNWVDNLRDWCISRQIWFGHRIPAWHPATLKPNDPKGHEYRVSIEDINDPDWVQDSDTLDTWFSSGLWTFSTLGWPNQTSNLATFHPTDLMDPGYEILYLWVSRMILFSGFLLGDIPFKKAAIHGMVRDNKGNKFSKSSGIGGDPLEVTALYGTDALRMALVSGVALGNDPVFDIQKVKGMKHFGNKLWNIARFVMTNVESSDHQFQALTEADKVILEKLNSAIATTTVHIEEFRLHEAAQEIYQFTWHELADIYLEASKEQLKDPQLTDNTKKILLHNLIIVLKLLHPFMPFITEHIWQLLNERQLLNKGGLLLVAQWPK